MKPGLCSCGLARRIGRTALMVIIVSFAALVGLSPGVGLRGAILPSQYIPRPPRLSSLLLYSVLENIWYLEAGDRLRGYLSRLLPSWVDLIRLASRSLEVSVSHSSNLLRFFNSSGTIGIDDSDMCAAWIIYLQWFSVTLGQLILAFLHATDVTARSFSNLRLYILKNSVSIVIIIKLVVVIRQKISWWEIAVNF